MEATQPPEAARSEGVPTAIVLDTSASMLGKSSEGTTLFDIARFAVSVVEGVLYSFAQLTCDPCGVTLRSRPRN